MWRILHHTSHMRTCTDRDLDRRSSSTDAWLKCLSDKTHVTYPHLNTNPSHKIWINLEKLVSRCPMSNQGYTQTMIQLKALQTRIHCVYTGERKIEILLEEPWLQGNRKQKKIQKRGASAQRTQADHSRRESLMSRSSRDPISSGRPDAVIKEQ